MRKFAAIIFMTALLFFATSRNYTAYSAQRRIRNLSRPIELQTFFNGAKLKDVEDAVTSGRLDPKKIFGSDSMLDFAITYMPNYSTEKAAVIRFLIDKGANPNHTGKTASVLCRAASMSTPEVITVLLDAGATNTYNMYGLSLAELANRNRYLRNTSIISRLQSVN